MNGDEYILNEFLLEVMKLSDWFVTTFVHGPRLMFRAKYDD